MVAPPRRRRRLRWQRWTRVKVKYLLSLRHCVHIQTHNSDVNQDEAPCRTAWRREQCRHKPQPGQCLGAFLDLGG